MEEKNELKDFGVTLNRMRLEKKLSMQKFADSAKMAKSTIHRIEKGDLNFSFAILIALAKALKISPAEFFKK